MIEIERENKQWKKEQTDDRERETRWGESTKIWKNETDNERREREKEKGKYIMYMYRK